MVGTGEQIELAFGAGGRVGQQRLVLDPTNPRRSIVDLIGGTVYEPPYAGVQRGLQGFWVPSTLVSTKSGRR